MTSVPHITVAPNGARMQKSDHADLPMTDRELAETARKCQAAGARCIHLHVRDSDGVHSLDPGLYRTAISAVSRAAPGMDIQVTTEAAGRYDVAEQLHLLRDLRPTAASISVREIARMPELAPQIYSTALAQKTRVQHIVYGPGCIAQLVQWQAMGLVPANMNDAILVLGQYSPPRSGRPDDLGDVLNRARDAELRVTVCAFGPQEQACLVAAAKLGCDLRVGFENNIRAPDGSIWADNAAAVASLRSACAEQLGDCTG